jgi:hypothetical protein
MLALVVAMGIAWLGRLGSLDIDQRNVAEKAARRLQIAAEMDSAGSNMLASMRGIVLFTAAGEPAEAAVSKQEFDSAAGRWRKAIGDLQPLLVQDDQRRLVNQMQDRLMAWRLVVVEVERAAARGDSEAALKIASGQGYPIYRLNARDTARFREFQDGTVDAQRANAASLFRAGWWTDFGALGLAAGAGLLTLFFARHTSRTPRFIPEQAAPAVEAAAPAVEAGGIVEGVDETAFQANLLRLNAALEGALSGQPTELPVAAHEDGNLVRRSAPAARDAGPVAGTTG